MPDVATSSMTVNANSKHPKKIPKANKEYLGYCDDPNNKEILARMSDEENEYVHDFFPLMTRPLQANLVPLGKIFLLYFYFEIKLGKRKK